MANTTVIKLVWLPVKLKQYCAFSKAQLIHGPDKRNVNKGKTKLSLQTVTRLNHWH